MRHLPLSHTASLLPHSSDRCDGVQVHSKSEAVAKALPPHGPRVTGRYPGPTLAKAMKTASPEASTPRTSVTVAAIPD